MAEALGDQRTQLAVKRGIKKVLFAKLQLQCFKVENAYTYRKPMPGYQLVKDRKEPDTRDARQVRGANHAGARQFLPSDGADFFTSALNGTGPSSRRSGIDNYDY